MPTLETSNLKSLADLCFEDFKILDLQSQNRADVYYRTLRQEAEKADLQSVMDYAELAGNVVNNSNLGGVLANRFAEVVANKNNIDFSIGSENHLRMQYELMQADMALRSNPAQTLTGELDFNQTNHMHETALGTVGLPPEAFSLYTPLNILAEHDNASAQSFFETVLSGEGILDVGEDLLVNFEDSTKLQQQLFDVLTDYAAQAEWLDTLLEVMQDFIVFLPGDISEINGRIKAYQQLLNLAEGVFDNIADRLINSSQEVDITGVSPSLPIWFKDLSLWNSFDINLPSLPIPGFSMLMNLNGAEVIDLLPIDDNGKFSFDTKENSLRDKTDSVTQQNSLLALDPDDHGTIEIVTELIGPEILQGYFL